MTKDDIKFAHADDIPQLVSLCYSSFKDNKLEGLGVPTDFNKITIGVTNCVYDQFVVVKRNEEDPKKIDGCFIGRFDTLWWSEEPILACAVFYVKPEFRSFKLAKAFLDTLKEYAIIQGVPCGMDLFVNRDTQKKRNLLTYMGFKEVGSYYIFNPLKENQKE